MPRTGAIQHIMKAGAFVAGELFAGEWGLDLTGNQWYYSRNGTTVETQSNGPGGSASLSGLTDVQLAGLAEGHIFSYNATTNKWVNRTLAQIGALAAAEKGAPNGVATLGSDGKVPASQMGALALTSVTVVASQAAQLALTDQGAGDFAIRSDSGVTYVHNGGSAGTMADWTVLPANDTSVDATHIVSGTLAQERYNASVVAALNAAPAGTIANGNLKISCGTL